MVLDAAQFGHDSHAGVRREQECYDLTESVLERDPYALECLPAHLASAVELRKKNELFMRGHMCARLVVLRAPLALSVT